jgi:PAS domain S-box-containing protein
MSKRVDSDTLTAENAPPSEALPTLEFMLSILGSSTEYSIIGKDLDGNILLWNEGARRLYGYAPEEVVGKANSAILHTPEDVQSGLPGQITAEALRKGKWEGVVRRVRKGGEQFSARLVITPRLDSKGNAVGFVLISKDISREQRFSEDLRRTNLFDRAIVGDPQEAVDFITNILQASTEYSIIGKGLRRHNPALERGRSPSVRL